MNRAGLAAGILLAAIGLATAAPRSINDCEKIADPDAYNRCLASFGPAAKPGRFTEAPPSSQQVAPAAQPRGRQGRTGYAKRSSVPDAYMVRTRHGRIRMTIDVGRSTSRSKATRGRGRRR